MQRGTKHLRDLTSWVAVGVIEPDHGGGHVKFGDFLFPDCRDPADDGRVIDETLREAQLADDLGAEVIWLAEHHFDGISVYGDPIALAGALAATLRQAGLGFAVIQTALHHPIRLAEQMTFLDHLLQGRLIVGLGRGSSFNIYDYQGFGIDHHGAQASARRGRKHHDPGLDRRRVRTRGSILAIEGADAAAASLQPAAPAGGARLIDRRLAH